MTETEGISTSHSGGLAKALRRGFDIIFSGTSLLALSPLLAVLAIVVKRGSKGPVIYRQERIGMHGRPFMICKFRTMAEESEPDGPVLSFDGDPRVNRVGKFLRRYHLDELPQLWNVVKGDMSVVGPRPERAYFIDQIKERDPRHRRVLDVRPGLSSWGMVNCGYASDVDKMVERLQYDLDYLDRRSPLFDLKIMIYTIKTIVKGKGI